MVKTKFNWDDEKRQHLKQLFEEFRPVMTLKQMEKRLAEEFTRKYNCTLAGSTLRLYVTSENSQVNQGGRPAAFKWDQHNEEFLLELFLDLPEALPREKQQENLHDNFTANYPECKLSAASLRCRAFELSKRTLSPCTSTVLDSGASVPSKLEKLDEECLRYLRFGLKLSSKRLYNYTCSNCGVLLSERRGRKKNYSNEKMPAVVEQFFDVDTIPPYMKPDGRMIVCSKCASSRPSPLKTFSTAKDGTKHSIPSELANLNIQEKCDLALTGLFSRTYKPKSRLFGVYKQTRGEYNCLHKDDRRYGDLHALIISNEKEVVRNKKRLYKALKFLKHNNPLYESYFANYETLFRFHKPKPGDPSFVPVYGSDFKPEHLQSKLDMLNTEKTKIALLIPSHDVLEVDDAPYSLVRAIQHPKLEQLQAEVNHIFQTYLGYHNPTLEPRTWPYLFPYGKGGHEDRRWNEKASSNVLSFKDYVYWRLLNAWDLFRQEQSYIFVMLDKMIKLDIMSFNFVRRINVQNQVKKLTVDDLDKDSRNPYNRYGTEVPKTIKNSSNFWGSKFRELLALANEYDRPPDAFITLTQNDSWPEIQAYVFGGVLQDPPELSCHDIPLCVPHGKTFPVDYPVEVSTAFYRRIADFFGLIVHNKEGIFGTILDYWARVELQQRGGLHLHFVAWTELPIDSLISAQLPRFDHAQNDYFRQLVSKFQTHSCRDKCRVGPKGRQLANCKYGFPFTPHEGIKLDSTGIRYLYERVENEDRNIASYNLPLLLLWQGHVNVQKVTDNGWKMYLTKYISKPEKAENIVFADRDKPPSAPERFLKTRVCVSTEAAAILTKEKFVFTSRFFHFCTTDLNAKRTLKRKEHMPKDSASTDIFYKNQLDHYLDRPENLKSVTYDEYNRKYYFSYSSGQKKLIKRENLDAIPVYWNYAPYGDTQEAHYLQQYLLHKSVSRTTLSKIICERNVTKTYLEQCLLDNITTTRHEAEAYLKKSVNRGVQMDKLRALAEAMSRENLIDAAEVQEMLMTVAPEHENILAALCENIDDEDNNDADCRLAQGKEATEDFLRSFTQSQQQCFRYIVDKINRHSTSDTATGTNQVLALITGDAGVGKSFMLKALECLCRERGLGYRTLATTGVAAHLIGGQTIHSAFKLNVESLRTSIEKGDLSAAMIQSLQVLFIDEFSMLTLDVFTAVDDICRKFSESNDLQLRPFGGKTVVMFGDVLQLEAIGQGIYLQDILTKFDVIVLKEKCRQADPTFIALLNNVRIGNLTITDKKLLESRIVLPHELPNPEDDDVMFLVPLRAQRDQINNHVLNKLNGQTFTFSANDFEPNRTPASEQVKNAIRKSRTEKYFPSVLHLKQNAKVMLTRNRDVSRGWCNGTLCRIKTISLKPEYVIVERLGNRKALLDVQRVQHTFKLGKSSTECTREQFPLVPCYSTTIHKAQGSTLKKVVIACKGMFASGAFYTALSRATTLDNVVLTDFDEDAVYCNQQFVQLWSWIQSRDVLSTNFEKQSAPFPDVDCLPLKFTDLDYKVPEMTLPDSFPSGTACFVPRLAQDILPGIDVHKKEKRKLSNSSSSSECTSRSSAKSRARSFESESSIGVSKLKISSLRTSGPVAVQLKSLLQNVRYLYETGNNETFLLDVIELINSHDVLTQQEELMATSDVHHYNGTDRTTTFANFYRQFEHDYRIVCTTGDGHCLYRAISKALTGTENHFLTFRLLAIKIIVNDADHFWQHHLVYNLASSNVEEFIYKTAFWENPAPQSSWGGPASMTALARCLNRSIMTFTWLFSERGRQSFAAMTRAEASAAIKTRLSSLTYPTLLGIHQLRAPIKIYFSGNHFEPLLRTSGQPLAAENDLIAEVSGLPHVGNFGTSNNVTIDIDI